MKSRGQPNRRPGFFPEKKKGTQPVRGITPRAVGGRRFVVRGEEARFAQRRTPQANLPGISVTARQPASFSAALGRFGRLTTVATTLRGMRPLTNVITGAQAVNLLRSTRRLGATIEAVRLERESADPAALRRMMARQGKGGKVRMEKNMKHRDAAEVRIGLLPAITGVLIAAASGMIFGAYLRGKSPAPDKAVYEQAVREGREGAMKTTEKERNAMHEELKRLRATEKNLQNEIGNLNQKIRKLEKQGGMEEELEGLKGKNKQLAEVLGNISKLAAEINKLSGRVVIDPKKITSKDIDDLLKDESIRKMLGEYAEELAGQINEMKKHGGIYRVKSGNEIVDAILSSGLGLGPGRPAYAKAIADFIKAALEKGVDKANADFKTQADADLNNAINAFLSGNGKALEESWAWNLYNRYYGIAAGEGNVRVPYNLNERNLTLSTLDAFRQTLIQQNPAISNWYTARMEAQRLDILRHNAQTAEQRTAIEQQLAQANVVLENAGREVNQAGLTGVADLMAATLANFPREGGTGAPGHDILVHYNEIGRLVNELGLQQQFSQAVTTTLGSINTGQVSGSIISILNGQLVAHTEAEINSLQLQTAQEALRNGMQEAENVLGQ